MARTNDMGASSREVFVPGEDSGLGGEGQGCGCAVLPSPLVGEGGALWSAIALLSATDEGSMSAEADSSADRDPSPGFALRSHPLPQGERVLSVTPTPWSRRRRPR